MDGMIPKSNELVEAMDFIVTSEGSNTSSVSEDKDETTGSVEMNVADESGGGDDDAADVLDLEKLQNLLQQSKQAANKIAGKDVMLLIGGTGAGKVCQACGNVFAFSFFCLLLECTPSLICFLFLFSQTTTTLYLAGATFEEEIVGGVEHYVPRGLPDEVLAEFAVSGSATSVTKTIHATTVSLPNGENVTICDTPGFGDTKGVEMEISNGLGVIHALKKARSVKPVLVFDREVMAGGRYAMLRKTLEIVILMMGKQSDFSSFEYIFTRCERKKSKRIHEQLAHFQRSRHEETGDSISGDEAVLDALLADMTQKTTPEAINIEPDDDDARSEKWGSLWKNGHVRLENPETAFNDFVSEESHNKLMLQVNRMVARMDMALKMNDPSSFEVILQNLVGLAETLPLQIIKKAVQDGRKMGQNFVYLLRSRGDSLTNQMAITPSADDYKTLVSDFCSLLQNFLRLDSLSKLCEVSTEESFNSFLGVSTAKVFGHIQAIISKLQENTGAEGWPTDLQSALLCLAYAIDNFEVFSESGGLYPFYESSLNKAHSLINFRLSAVEETLQNLTSEGLEASRDNLLRLWIMNNFFQESKNKVETEILCQVKWSFLNDRVNDILGSLVKWSRACLQNLNEHTCNLESTEDFTQSMSCTSLVSLSKDGEAVKCRSFLLALSSSSDLENIVEAHAKEMGGEWIDIDMSLAHFDVQLCGSLKKFADFSHGWASEKKNTSEKKEAEQLMESIGFVLKVCKDYRETDVESVESAKERLNGTEGRLKVFLEKCNSFPQRPDELLYGPDVLGKAFHARLVELRAFKIQHGHCRVPQKYKTNPSLGTVSSFCHSDLNLFAHLTFSSINSSLLSALVGK